MNRREFVVASVGVALVTPFRVVGQSKTIEPDLGALADGKGLNASGRTITRLTDGPRKGVRLSEAQGEGPAYLPGIEFANGTLELDIKGRDVQGASFVGVAFHGVMAPPTTRSTSVRSISRPRIRHGFCGPCNTSRILPIPGRSCGQKSRGNTRSL